MHSSLRLPANKRLDLRIAVLSSQHRDEPLPKAISFEGARMDNNDLSTHLTDPARLAALRAVALLATPTERIIRSAESAG